MKRTLSLFDVTCIGLNAIVGSGIFALPDDLFREMGGLAPLAFALCAVGLLPIALSYAEAASQVDRTGGPYIYASEALFRARIDPRRPADTLTLAESGRLARGVREVLREAIDFRGTTLLDYRDADGNSGEFAKRLRVYDREGEPCLRCGRPIQRIVQANRSTFFCPRCQR